MRLLTPQRRPIAAAPSESPPADRTGDPETGLAPVTAEGVSARTIGLLTFAVVLAVTLLHNRYVFTEHRYEDGDFAVNSMLIDRARHFQLLIGNYSRVGFHHPGPALLYVQAFSQLAFHDAIPLVRSPFDAHVLGVIILDAAMLGMCASIINERTRSLMGPVALVVGAFAYTWVEPGLLSSTWMPHVYVWPFLLLLVASASVASGASSDLWKVALAGGLLVHGHVSFVMFASVIAGLALAWVVVRRTRGGTWDLGRRPALATFGVLALFALPLVINLVLHWPGEFQKYLDYSSSNASAGHSLADAVHFVRLYWGQSRLAIPVAIVAAVFVFGVERGSTRRDARRFVMSSLGVMAVATILMLVYAVRGVDDLQQRYVGLFYYSVPILLLTVVTLAATDVLGRRVKVTRPLQVGVVIVVVVALAASGTRQELTNPYPSAPWLPDAYRAIETADPAGTLALRFESPAWPPAAGIIEFARRQGREVCIESRSWAFVFTDELICSPGELSSAHLLSIRVPGDPPSAEDFFTNAIVRVGRAR